MNLFWLHVQSAHAFKDFTVSLLDRIKKYISGDLISLVHQLMITEFVWQKWFVQHKQHKWNVCILGEVVPVCHPIHFNSTICNTICNTKWVVPRKRKASLPFCFSCVCQCVCVCACLCLLISFIAQLCIQLLLFAVLKGRRCDGLSEMCADFMQCC